VLILTVIKLESSILEQSPRFVVHCMQTLPEMSFKATQFEKYVTLPEHGSSYLSFPVVVSSIQWVWA
jgi:hypothetical protein